MTLQPMAAVAAVGEVRSDEHVVLSAEVSQPGLQMGSGTRFVRCTGPAARARAISALSPQASSHTASLQPPSC